jgi:hypothetical protein
MILFDKKVSITVIRQTYTSGPEEEYVIVGNDALMKCKIPSFVSDFVSVVSWVDSEVNEYYPHKNYGKLGWVIINI